MCFASLIPHQSSLPYVGGQDLDFAWFFDGHQYTVCYRDEEDGEAFVTHPDLDLGKAELVRICPREVLP